MFLRILQEKVEKNETPLVELEKIIDRKFLRENIRYRSDELIINQLNKTRTNYKNRYDKSKNATTKSLTLEQGWGLALVQLKCYSLEILTRLHFNLSCHQNMLSSKRRRQKKIEQAGDNDDFDNDNYCDVFLAFSLYQYNSIDLQSVLKSSKGENEENSILKGNKDNFLPKIFVQIELLTLFDSTVITNSIAASCAKRTLCLLEKKEEFLKHTDSLTLDIKNSPVERKDDISFIDKNRLQCNKNVILGSIRRIFVEEFLKSKFDY